MPKELSKTLRDNKIWLTKKRGQNFLMDNNIRRKIIEVANLNKSSRVLEVGPGMGALTEVLADKAGQVLAVEYDKKLADLLKQKFAKNNNVEIWQEDILKTDLAKIKKHLGEAYEVVANLPYNISSRFLRLFLSHEARPRRMIIMLQKEVAERIMARPGEMSVLAVAVQYYAEPKILFKVKPGSFFPPPKVDSAVMKIVMRKSRYQVPPEDFFKVLKAGFSAKRKKLASNLQKVFDNKQKTMAVLAELGLPEDIRAEELSVEQWADLAKRRLSK